MMHEVGILLGRARELLDSGDLSRAAAVYRDVLNLQAQEPQALSMLALIAQQTGKAELALNLTEAALQVAPEQAALWANYATLLRQLERGDPRAAAEEALKRDAHLPEALDIAGYLAREAGEVRLACDLHAQAVALAPQNARMRANYALALMSGFDFAAAFEAAQTALRLDSTMAFAQMVMGQVVRGAGDAISAAPYFERAAMLEPDYHDAAMQAAQAWLVAGQWDKGWPWWEKRRYDAARFAHVPRWDGGKVGHLLVHAEQGFGDTLQCLRWVGDLRKRADRVTVQVPAALRRLAVKHLPGVAVIGPSDAVPAVDAHVLLMSLPYLLDVKPDAPSAPLAVRADEADGAAWRERMAGIPRPRIGFVPMGNPKHANDRNRSLPDAVATTFSAQFGDRISVLLDGRILGGGFAVTPKDFMETAGWMDVLDLVITVDTSAAHLAGSMGKATWLLLPFDPEWRWGYGREDTIWYPSVRIFRQERPGDWDEVMGRVFSALSGESGFAERPPS